MIHFWADWAEQCKQIDEVLNALLEMHKENIKFYRVEAEEVNGVSEKFDISAVPERLIFHLFLCKSLFLSLGFFFAKNLYLS